MPASCGQLGAPCTHPGPGAALLGRLDALGVGPPEVDGRGERMIARQAGGGIQEDRSRAKGGLHGSVDGPWRPQHVLVCRTGGQKGCAGVAGSRARSQRGVAGAVWARLRPLQHAFS